MFECRKTHNNVKTCCKAYQNKPALITSIDEIMKNVIFKIIFIDSI
ncbi:hypothetical protein EDEG_00647 [Edhazardia aedis USNM 41457]|uniref:Uncharacterized protein n=1 Tax=Edhazardia aedis (strain USNM 41457) TaxID=1003232 RepID=J9DCU5_EDHAE|nr:hypothetical protein EDEG_00647 [Edhazardia aedis USNM 41457]|eukprot:EJW05289.1 hypothetical protein EDEG_00647 [Edhazardia aedis USNM 41457]